MAGPSFVILEKIRGGMNPKGLDLLIADQNTSIEVWNEALKGYQRYLKLIALWDSKRPNKKLWD
jgi:hypothetical protein